MGKYSYDYPMPAATVDLAVFVVEGEVLKVLMIQRKHDPHAGRWAFPGGFVEIDEPFEAAARREMKEETGLKIQGTLGFVGVFGAPGRDPRGRTISIAHATVLRGPCPSVHGSDDATVAQWIDANRAHDLAFDHDTIMSAAKNWLISKVEEGPVGLALLPERFHSNDVVAMHRAVMGHAGGAKNWLSRMIKRAYVTHAPHRGTYVGEHQPVKSTKYEVPFLT
jgi:8-oxo-dGTP diphosphatase